MKAEHPGRTAVGVLTLALLLVVAGVPGPIGGADAAISDTQEATVTEVIDGDTVDVRFPNGSTDTVRLLGIDTPEDSSGNQPEEYEGVPDNSTGSNCLGDEGGDATDYLTQRLEGETVTLEYDSEADRRGDFGRLLAYIKYDGEDVNYELVRTGRARVFDSTFSRSDSYYSAESNAQDNLRDLWRCRNAGGRGDIDIEAIEPDPAGNDSENLDDGNTYTFGTVLLVRGGEVTLHTGSGTDTVTDVYWGRSSPVWDNGGENVTVRNPDGQVGTTRLYD
ncbi:endonuclease [Halobacteriales archaeon QS_1_69_70]|nr:MAG: endonuclease [Halobacteriales archaeon QS_1_69_70]